MCIDLPGLARRHSVVSSKTFLAGHLKAQQLPERSPVRAPTAPGEFPAPLRLEFPLCVGPFVCRHRCENGTRVTGCSTDSLVDVNWRISRYADSSPESQRVSNHETRPGIRRQRLVRKTAVVASAASVLWRACGNGLRKTLELQSWTTSRGARASSKSTNFPNTHIVTHSSSHQQARFADQE